MYENGYLICVTLWPFGQTYIINLSLLSTTSPRLVLSPKNITFSHILLPIPKHWIKQLPNCPTLNKYEPTSTMSKKESDEIYSWLIQGWLFWSFFYLWKNCISKTWTRLIAIQYYSFFVLNTMRFLNVSLLNMLVINVSLISF